MPVYLVLGGGARTAAPLRALAEETGATAYPLDATSYEQVQGIVDHAVARHGRIDGAVNLVGSIFLKPAHLTSADEFDTAVSLNLKTAFYLVKAAARAIADE